MVFNTLYYPNQLGGAEKSVQLIAERLVEIGHDVVVVCIEPSGYRAPVTLNGVEVIYFPLRNFWPMGPTPLWKKVVFFLLDSYNPFVVGGIKRVIRQHRPDVIYTNNILGFSPAVWRTAGLLKVPIVHTPRDYYALCTNGDMYRNGKNCDGQCFKCKIYSIPRRKYAKKVSAVAGISNFVTNVHSRAEIFESSVTCDVILNPHKGGRPEAKSLDRPQARVFGYLGRLSAKKGIELLLKQFSALDVADSILYVAGTGEKQYVESLKAQFECARVQFVGHVVAEQFLPSIDVLVVPSLWNEPFGRTVIEAYSFGLPVISTRRGGLGELLQPGLGWYFDADDGASLSEALVAACNSAADTVAINDESKKYDVERVVERLERVLEKTVRLEQAIV